MKTEKSKNRKVYLIVMLAVLIVVSVCFVVLTGKFVKWRYEERVHVISQTNRQYRELLSITGNYIVSIHGVEYMKKAKPEYLYLVYGKIAFIKTFNPNSTFNYNDVPTLLEEYNAFCETGDNSEILDKLYADYSAAESSAESSFMEVSQAIRSIKTGYLHIDNNQVIYTKNAPEFDEEYLQMVDSVDGNEALAACMYYEKYSDIIVKQLTGHAEKIE